MRAPRGRSHFSNTASPGDLEVSDRSGLDHCQIVHLGQVACSRLPSCQADHLMFCLLGRKQVPREMAFSAFFCLFFVVVVFVLCFVLLCFVFGCTLQLVGS